MYRRFSYISVILSYLAVILFFVIPASFFIAPKKASACLGGGAATATAGASAGLTAATTALGAVAVPTFDRANASLNYANLVQNSISAAASSELVFKECVEDGFMVIVAKTIIKSFTQATVQWINSGFKGSPTYVQNLGGFLTDIGDKVFVDFAKELFPDMTNAIDFVCSPFKLEILASLQLKYNHSYSNDDFDQCRLSDIIKNVQGATIDIDGSGYGDVRGYTNGNFAAGGWDAWFSLTQNQKNNKFGGYLEAQGELSARLTNAQGEQLKLLDFGDGFHSLQEVVKGVNKIITPGAAINSQLENLLNSDLRQLELADEINEIVGALVGQLIKQVMGSGGLFGAGDGNGIANGDGFGVDRSMPNPYGNPLDGINPGEGTFDPGAGGGGNTETNVANYKTNSSAKSKMSSVYQNNTPASNANDGMALQSIENYQAVSNEEVEPWWEVDLGKSYNISRVRVYPRTDHGELSNYYILISNQPFSGNLASILAKAGAGGSVQAIEVTGASASPDTATINNKGRYVRIMRKGPATTRLELSEVEVYGTDPDAPVDGGTGGGIDPNPGCTTNCTPTSIEGYTTFKETQTINIFVSSSAGNDANDGRDPKKPVKTLRRAQDLARKGYADWIRLKKGDVWDEAFGTWSKGGISPNEPMLITSYGTGARPLIRTSGGASGISIGTNVSNLAIVGLHFQSHYKDGDNGLKGIQLGNAFQNILIEDVYIQGYKINIGTESCTCSRNNLAIRRSILADAYTKGGTGHGIYLSSVNGALIEENVLDHNGWNNGNANLFDKNAPYVPITTGFGQGMYLQYTNTNNITVRNNIIARSVYAGVQLRRGGKIEDNLSIANNVGFIVGLEPSTVKNNVVLDGVRNTVRASGIEVDPIETSVIEGNIVSGAEKGSVSYTISTATSYNADKAGFDSDLVNNVNPWTFALRNNISYNFGTGIMAEGGVSRIKNASVANNKVVNTRTDRCFDQQSATSRGGVSYSGNIFSCTGGYLIDGYTKNFTEWKSFSGDTSAVESNPGFSSPNRTVATYNSSVAGGLASLDSFIAEARKQSRDNWRTAYTAKEVNKYIRAGFQ